MNSSILTSIKKMLGIAEADTTFDVDIIIHINTVFMVLNQIGTGPEAGYHIEDKNDLWADYIDETDDLESIKTYIYLKVKLLFDPPASSAVIEAYKQSINELEWRINIRAETNYSQPLIDKNPESISDEEINDLN